MFPTVHGPKIHVSRYNRTADAKLSTNKLPIYMQLEDLA